MSSLLRGKSTSSATASGKRKEEMVDLIFFSFWLHVSLSLHPRFDMAGLALWVGWFLHYFPFFLMNRQLFMHHYLPAAIFR